MANKLKVGIVGCGVIASHTHIPIFKTKSTVIVEAVCDRNENLARETASKLGIPKAYFDLSQMLSNEKLDIIDICTPPQTHASLAIEAMNRGCHVFMEKPMALKTSDCDQMISVSRKRGVNLCVFHNVLFDPPFLKAKKLLADGAIGDFIGMRILMSDPREEMIMQKNHWIHKLPGGLIGETGPHAAYMSLAFLKKVKNADIYAKNFLIHPWAPFDEFRIELEGEKAMSSITISYTSNRRNLYIDILGTDGVLYLDIQSQLLTHHGRKETVRPMAFARYSANIASQTVTGVATNAFKLMTKRLKFGHHILIEGFVKSILTGDQPPVTPEEGRETVKVMEMIVEKLYEKYGSQLTPHS